MIDQDAPQADLAAPRTAVDGRTTPVAACTTDLDAPRNVVAACATAVDGPTTDLAAIRIDQSACRVAITRREIVPADYEVAVDDCDFASAGLLFAVDRRGIALDVCEINPDVCEIDLDICEIHLDVCETDLDVREVDVDVLEIDLDVFEIDLDVFEIDGAGPFSDAARLATHCDAPESGVDALRPVGAAHATRPESPEHVPSVLFLGGSTPLGDLDFLGTVQGVQGFLHAEATVLGAAVRAPLRGQLDAVVAQGRAAEAEHATLAGSTKGESAGLRGGPTPYFNSPSSARSLFSARFNVSNFLQKAKRVNLRPSSLFE